MLFYRISLGWQRLDGGEQALGGGGHLGNGGIEGLSANTAGRAVAADFAHVLEGGGSDLVVANVALRAT
jgi:hypothetical protein